MNPSETRLDSLLDDAKSRNPSILKETWSWNPPSVRPTAPPMVRSPAMYRGSKGKVDFTPRRKVAVSSAQLEPSQNSEIHKDTPVHEEL